MAKSPLLNFEWNLLKACENLGKGLIQQCLLHEAPPTGASFAVLSDACHALAKDILQHADKKIKEEGRVTQKTIVSLACRKLAEIIKGQCPRGEGEFSRTWDAVESILSEPSLTTKLSEIINSRELVACVCDRHEVGLSTVLLAACHWLVTDMKTLFLCEEVWSNLFCKEGFVQHALYSQMRILLNTVIFQITLEAEIRVPSYPDSREQTSRHQGKERAFVHSQQRRNCDVKALREGLREDCVDHALEAPGVHSLRAHNEPQLCKHHRLRGITNDLYRARSMVTELENENLLIDMLIHDRASHFSYVIELRNDPTTSECRAAIKKLWLILTQPVEELCDAKVCYLLTIGRHPIHELGLWLIDKDRDVGFLRDVSVLRIGYPIWPKDKSVIKRWFLYPEDQHREEIGDQGNKCVQIWRVGSLLLEKRLVGRSREVIMDLESLKTESDIMTTKVVETQATSCFHFLKKNRKM
ncbi:hypothetical protein NDU88_003297 [Pleurodeles waltl]|uniref:Uncharacterized protein n=1 Tax=Pleurodeles waltl TaxID=8319 RepID=A0AAV7VGR0_PLEWA|nr:hypothetical protein NDU88_003297 [Pleurodeles waltl]